MDIGAAIKTFRKKKGMTQAELARRSGISANALCSIEKDKSFPTKETIKAICTAMDIPTGYLLFSAITEDDVPQDKLEVFRILQKPIMEMFEI